MMLGLQLVLSSDSSLGLQLESLKRATKFFNQREFILKSKPSVGVEVGVAVGVAVGVEVGLDVGLFVGVTDGALEGDVDGLLVGVDVGVAEKE